MRRRRATRAERAATAAVAEGFSPYTAALGMAENDPAVQRVIGLFGGEPVVSEFRVGVPVHHDRHLCFAGGGEILLRDGVVRAVFFHLRPTDTAPGGFQDLGAVIPGLGTRATQEQVETAMGEPMAFTWTPTGARYTVGTGVVAVRYRAEAATGERYLEQVRISAEGVTVRWVPAHERCGTCADLLVREGAPGSSRLDVPATASALARGVETGKLAPVRGWVRPADLHPLLVSGLMERVVVRVRCKTCGFVLGLGIEPSGVPTFEYLSPALAEKHDPMPIPPVELWAGPERVAREREGLRVIDHGPSAWFLLQDGDDLHLEARYSYSGLIDDSALITLDADEQRLYRDRGSAFIAELQQEIHESGPFQASSRYFRRDQYRGPDRRALRAAVSEAIGIWRQDELWRSRTGGSVAPG